VTGDEVIPVLFAGTITCFVFTGW